jgi:hypothetical protein
VSRQTGQLKQATTHPAPMMATLTFGPPVMMEGKVKEKCQLSNSRVYIPLVVLDVIAPERQCVYISTTSLTGEAVSWFVRKSTVLKRINLNQLEFKVPCVGLKAPEISVILSACPMLRDLLWL